MRIAQIHTRYLQHGGEDVAVEAEARLLRGYGHEVIQLQLSNQELVGLSPIVQGARTVWNGQRRRWLQQELAAVRPDVAHFHNTFPALSPAAYHAVPSSTRCVQTLHNYRLICPAGTLSRDGAPCHACVGHSAWRSVLFACYRESRPASLAVAGMLATHRALGTWSRVHRFIALSAFARSMFVQGGLPADRIVVKPNHLDPDPGEGPHDQPYYLFVGRLTVQKGILILLDAWKRIPGAPRLKVVGDGELAAEVMAASGASGIEAEGAVDHARVLELMRHARALVFPSLSYENSPFAIVEAFATGLPVLASRLDNLSDIVQHGVSGLLFGAADAAALARTVAAIEAEPAQLRALGAGARREYLARYTGEAAYHALLAVYRAERAPLRLERHAEAGVDGR